MSVSFNFVKVEFTCVHQDGKEVQFSKTLLKDDVEWVATQFKEVNNLLKISYKII